MQQSVQHGLVSRHRPETMNACQDAPWRPKGGFLLAGKWRDFLPLLVQAEKPDKPATAGGRPLAWIHPGTPAKSGSSLFVGVHRKLLGSQAALGLGSVP